MSIDTIIGIIILVLAAAAIIWFGVVKKVPAVKKIALSLVIEAERKYGSGTGLIKFASVVGEIYSRLPFLIQLFITEKILDDLIKEAVEIMKITLGEAKIRASQSS